MDIFEEGRLQFYATVQQNIEGQEEYFVDFIW